MSRLHVGALANSPAQQRVLEYLRRCGAKGATTWQISAEARVQNVATWVSQLRHNSFNIECKYLCMVNGARLYRYWLKPADAQEVA